MAKTFFRIQNKNKLFFQEKINDEKNTVAVATIYSSDDISNGNNSLLNMQQPQLEVRPATTYRIPNAFNIKPTSSMNPPLNSNEQDALNSALSDSATSSKIFSKSEGVTLARPSSGNLISKLVPPKQTTSAPNSASHQCIHHMHGQELCYLCHQRQRRNVPLYLHEETRQKELEEDQLLMQYQQLKDMEKQLKDEEKRNVQRLDRAKVDAFNLGVTEAVKAKKQERPKSGDMSVIIKFWF